MKRIVVLFSVFAVCCAVSIRAEACTGIALRAADGSNVVARTVEWAEGPMQCGYVVAPRGHEHRSFTPTGENGLKYKSVYGYVGIYTEYEPFVVEGMNEAGLSAGLFFFPGYGEYAPYREEHNAKTLCDMQFVSWVLSRFSTIEQVRDAMHAIDLVTLSHKIGSVHWRITEPSGKMAVVEVVNGVPRFYDNRLGVLTNSPGFPWQMTNLDNYVNLHSGAAPSHDIKPGVELRSTGGGSGMLGLPGDFTPPSRFVRAAFFQTASPQRSTGFETVLQAFHILNCFDVPIGVQSPEGKVPDDMPSATQFTAAADQNAMKLYYRTAWNSNIRCIDMMNINFHNVRYQSHPLDDVKVQPVEIVKVK